MTSQHPFLETSSIQVKDPTPCKRGPLDKTFQNEERDIIEEKLASYANCLPFNLVRSQYWRVSAINSALTDFISSGFEKMCATLLEREECYRDLPLTN